MRATQTLCEVGREPRYWTIRVPKPRLGTPSWREVRYAAVLAMSLGFNVGFIAPALASEASGCQASAELHWHLSGGQDAAYEDAYEACTVGMTYTEWLAYEPSECEGLAGAAYDRTGDPEVYRTTEALCEAMVQP